MFANPRGFSQLTTSFFAFESLGIPHLLFLTFSPITAPFAKTVTASFSFLNNVNELLSLSGIVTVAGFTPIYCLGSFEATAKYYLRVIASRKEVFQPHLPVRLPCYDLAPVISFALGRSLRSRTSGTPDSHGLTGGVYKARERIHRAMADARLLANPTSWRRVSASNPN